MPKQSLFFVFSLFATIVSAQQSNLTGIVTYHNSKFETGKTIPVQNATVEEAYDGKFSTLTRADGAFKMVLVGIENGKSISLNATKADEDLEVVNTDHLQAVAGQKAPLKICMASRKKLADARREYYRIGKTEAEKVLNDKYKKAQEELFALQERTEGNEARIAELQKELTALMADSRKIEGYAKDLAERYAKVNLDDASALYVKAFRQFQAGKLKEALAILQRADLAGQAEKIWEEEKKISNLRKEATRREIAKDSVKKEVMLALRLKADLHKAELEWDSVEATYELLVRLDTNDIDNIGFFSLFLRQQNNYPKAIFYIEKCLQLTKKKETEALFFQHLGDIYNRTNKKQMSEDMLLRSLSIYEQLAKQNPGKFEAKLADTYTHLGVTYMGNSSKIQESEKALLQALSIYERVTKTDSAQFEFWLGVTVSNLGMLYAETQRIQESEKMYLRALKILERMAKGNPSEYEPEFARVVNNAAVYYHIIGNIAEAKRLYLIALEMQERLTKRNPARHEPTVGWITRNLGLLYSNTQNMAEAKKMYLYTWEIYERLAKSHPKQFKPEVARAANSLGNFYADTGDSVEAEKMHLKAFEIREQLTKENPGYFEADLALTTLNLANLYQNIGKMPEAKTKYLYALNIFERLAKDDPGRIEQDLALTLTNLGNLFKSVGDMPQAESMYSRALEIYERLAINNPGKFESPLAGCLNSIGIYWLSSQQFDKAKNYFSRALMLRQKEVFKGLSYLRVEFIRVYGNLASLRDSFSHHKNYSAAAAIQHERAASLDSLRLVDSSFLAQVPLEYDTLARCYLLARDFPAAEAAARRGLALGPAQVQVNSHFAAALLFQGREKEAKAVYQSFSVRQTHSGGAASGTSQTYRDRCLQDIETLHKAGVVSGREVRRVKSWMK